MEFDTVIASACYVYGAIRNAPIDDAPGWHNYPIDINIC